MLSIKWICKAEHWEQQLTHSNCRRSGKERKRLREGHWHAYKISSVSWLGVSGGGTEDMRIKKAKVHFVGDRVRHRVQQCFLEKVWFDLSLWQWMIWGSRKQRFLLMGTEWDIESSNASWRRYDLIWACDSGVGSRPSEPREQPGQTWVIYSVITQEIPPDPQTKVGYSDPILTGGGGWVGVGMMLMMGDQYFFIYKFCLTEPAFDQIIRTK